MLKPPDLMNHVHLGVGASAVEQIPLRTVKAFQRIRDAKEREKHEVSIMLPPNENVSSS
jgi:pre-rRNA-processing protein IPI3